MNEYLPKVGECAIGTVVAVYSSYAILLFDEGWTGLLHISEVSFNYIRSFTSFITILLLILSSEFLISDTVFSVVTFLFTFFHS